jgi:hypothetical protein
MFRIRTMGMALAVCVALPALPLRAEDKTYDLRGPATKKGTVYADTTLTRIKDATVIARIGQAELKLGTASVDGDKKTEVEILAVNGHDVTRIRTHIVKDTTKLKGNLDGNDVNETEEDPLTGKVVISEWNGKKWTHKLEKGEPNEKEQGKLDEFDGIAQEYALYPTGRVPVGHKWESDAATLQKGMFAAMNAVDLTGKSTSHFIKIEKVAGEDCAVIETDLSVKGTRDSKGEKAPFAMSGKRTVYRSLATGDILKEDFDGKMTLVVVQKEDGLKTEIEISGPFTAHSTSGVKK